MKHIRRLNIKTKRNHIKIVGKEKFQKESVILSLVEFVLQLFFYSIKKTVSKTV